MPKTPITPLTGNNVLPLLPPFPLALITTRTNIITIGQLHYFTFKPLRLGIAVARVRYTYSLLQQEGEFVVNVPDPALVDAVKLCGSISGRNRDKFEAAGLDREESLQVQALSIRQCPAQIECRVEKKVEFEERTWFVGRVVAARVQEGFRGTQGLLCDRSHYALCGEEMAPR